MLSQKESPDSSNLAELKRKHFQQPTSCLVDLFTRLTYGSCVAQRFGNKALSLLLWNCSSIHNTAKDMPWTAWPFTFHKAQHATRFPFSSPLTYTCSPTYVLIRRMRDNKRNTDGTSNLCWHFIPLGDLPASVLVTTQLSASPPLTHVHSAQVTKFCFYRFWNRKSVTLQTRSSKDSKSANFPILGKLTHGSTF